MLIITTRMAGDVAVLTLSGRLVLEDTESPLRPEIERLMKGGCTKLILELSRVTYIDSAGLGLLVFKLVSLRKAGGDLRLVHPTPRSMHLMNITNLVSVFETYVSEDAAVRSFATS